MEEGYVYLNFQPINVIINDSNQLNNVWMFCSNINQKGMQDYLNIPKWHNLIWNAKTLLKCQIMFYFLHPCFLYFFSNLGM